MIKIRELTADTVAQSLEHMQDKQNAWVQILASIFKIICSIVLFLLCYPGEALEGPILTGVCII